MYTPTAEIRRPPHQQSAATTAALRGPTRSSHQPQIAAETPSSTKNRVNIQPRSNWVQSQSLANRAWPVIATLPQNVVASPGQAIGLSSPWAAATARPSGTQNTLKP